MNSKFTRDRRLVYSRRGFIANAAATFAGTVAAPLAGTLAASAYIPCARGVLDDVAATPNISFPAAARERIAIASYPFRQFITPTEPGETGASAAGQGPKMARQTAPKMELKDFAAHVVDKFKINKIEPWSVHFASQEPQYLVTLRAAFDAAHVSVVNIAVDGEHSIFAADPAERQRGIEESKRWIDTAAAIGSPSVRTHLAAAKDSPPEGKRAAESLHQVAEYGAKKNIVVNLENDNPVTEDAFFVAKLVATVHSPWLHALPDFANSLVVMQTAQAYDALDAMFSEAYNICHVKALEVNEIGVKYGVNMGKAFGILQLRNFKGYCSMEFDSPGDPYSGTSDLIKTTLHHLS